MFLPILHLLFSSCIVHATTATFLEPRLSAPEVLNITAITTDSERHSILQCWELDSRFETSEVEGIVGASTVELGGAAEDKDISYTVFPPEFDAGLHVAPSKQWNVVVSGFGEVQIPSTGQSVSFRGGVKNNLVIAADTADVCDDGHISIYPSKKETTVMQIPFKDGIIPSHRVLHDGPCESTHGCPGW